MVSESGLTQLNAQKPCSSAIYRRRTQFPTPDESGNYSQFVGLSEWRRFIARPTRNELRYYKLNA